MYIFCKKLFVKICKRSMMTMKKFLFFCGTNASLAFFSISSLSASAYLPAIMSENPDPVDSVGIEPFEPAYDYDYIPDASYEDIADRIACMDSDMPLNFNENVQAFVHYFTIRDRNYSRLMIARQETYFPVFEKYLKKYGLPDELKYLSIVESGLNPQARSRVGAVGLWQFMPSTGRVFGLDQDWYMDERMNPEKSTEAACKYLKQLYNMFDDWELALAAYNTGPGNVRKAIRRSGYKRDFWEIYNYLPRETRSYVPQFVAVAYALTHASEHNLYADALEFAIETDTVMVDKFISLKAMSEQLNVCEEELVKLNPELKRDVVPETTKRYALIIPADKYDFLTANRVSIIDSASSEEVKQEFEQIAQKISSNTYEKEKVVYKVRSGDVLGVIADRHGVGLSELQSWNNLHGSRIYAGQRLTIWVDQSRASKSNNTVLASKSSQSKVAPMKGKTYLVQPGDSLWEISKKYEGLSVARIKQLNNLRNNDIKPGQKLIIGQ